MVNSNRELPQVRQNSQHDKITRAGAAPADAVPSKSRSIADPKEDVKIKTVVMTVWITAEVPEDTKIGPLYLALPKENFRFFGSGHTPVDANVIAFQTVDVALAEEGEDAEPVPMDNRSP